MHVRCMYLGAREHAPCRVRVVPRKPEVKGCLVLHVQGGNEVLNIYSVEGTDSSGTGETVLG